VRDFSLSLHSLNRDLFAVVDIHSGLGRIAAYLEALQRPPVGVIVIGRTVDHCDACMVFKKLLSLSQQMPECPVYRRFAGVA
jgi:hypothetical protein